MVPVLRICVLGPFTVEGGLNAPVPTGKAARVLAVLALRAGELVPLDQLVDAVWPDADPPDRVDRNVAALVSRLRRALGRERIEGSPAGYRLTAESVAVDLNEAVELVQQADTELGRGRFAVAAAAGEQAVKLLAADTPLAGDRADRWVRALRDRVSARLQEARLLWSRAALELGAFDTAVQVGSAVLQADPLDEEACRVVMLAHQRAGRPGAALVIYRALREALAEHLGIDPSPGIQAVHLSVLRAEAVGARWADRDGPTGRSLVGRDAELRALRERWAAASAGSPSMVVLTGEAGLGKSSLARTLLAEAGDAGATVVQVACYAAEKSLYLQPVVQLVGALVHRMTATEIRELAGARLGTLTSLIPEVADVVGEAPYQRAGPELEHLRGLDALSGFLVRLGTRQPLLLAVEDVQHASDSTLQALHVLTQHWRGSRMMVLLTEDTTEDPAVTAALRDVASAVELRPLSRTDVADLVAQSGLAFDADRIWSWTGGSPLFVTEVLRAPAVDGRTDDLPIPHSLHDAVAARIEHAGAAVERLLALGSIFGTTFGLDELAALGETDVEACAEAASRAIRAGLLTEQGADFRFANDVVRQVAYSSVARPVRISRHRRAARLLAAKPEAAAEQLAAAGDHRGAAAAWAAAAEAAHLVFAQSDAERLLDRAVAAAAAGGDAAQLFAVHLRRGQVRCDLGRYADARADHETALELARDAGDLDLEARALEQLGWDALYARDAMGAVGLAEQATHLAETAAAAPGALPSASLLLGRVRHWDGDYAGAEAAYDRVLAANLEDAAAAVALAYRGALLEHQDRFGEAQDVLARAAMLCRRTGEFRPLLQTLFFTALARGNSGDFAGALRALGSARSLIDAEKLTFYRAGVETTTSWMWQELGQVDRAREHAEAAVELARRGGGALELEQELHALLAMADCDLMRGRTDDAAVLVESARPMLEVPLPFRPRAVMRLLEMRARWDRAVAEELLAEARRFQSPKYEALALHHLGRPAEAARLALATGSDLLVAQLGDPGPRDEARTRVAGRLPSNLRAGFVERGRLLAPARRTR
ncbi:AAA family ATPase [Pseudonocardia kujensis]|uniref:ATP-binding protein n=1 Tax=Pseudonocardia kujensis TaxID=1128675 RepID=UPI001E40386C|nr:AAA family ATPase [Pseudonocardia kujensis]MCE0764280.1 AAA family ATPase [Pseudonocardia kujensis]